MKRIDIKTFDYKNQEGKVLNCVEMVTNDKEEISKELYECNSEKEAKDKAEELNKRNTDNRYKYIHINYLVKNDELIAY